MKNIIIATSLCLLLGTINGALSRGMTGFSGRGSIEGGYSGIGGHTSTGLQNNFGRNRYWRSGLYGGYGYGYGYGYGCNNGAYVLNSEQTAPGDASFDKAQRKNIKRLQSLPTSAFVKTYHWKK